MLFQPRQRGTGVGQMLLERSERFQMCFIPNQTFALTIVVGVVGVFLPPFASIVIIGVMAFLIVVTVKGRLRLASFRSVLYEIVNLSDAAKLLSVRTMKVFVYASTTSPGSRNNAPTGRELQF
mmetsp:Transcript_27421/g.63228  ORF Transcript_27421/g.63228 Transcript_27421/m.63228 type:complete len:123 (-) Transcript_27421:192-560(-)